MECGGLYCTRSQKSSWVLHRRRSVHRSRGTILSNVSADSINEQIYFAVKFMVELLGKDVIDEVYGMDYSEYAPNLQLHYRNVTLNPQHPFFDKIRKRKDLSTVPESRFQEPIIRFWRCDMLLTFQELSRIVHESGAETSDEQLVKVPRILSDWRTGLRQYATVEPWKGELPGLVIMSTGPHYEILRLKPITDEQMLWVYEEMVCITRLTIAGLIYPRQS